MTTVHYYVHGRGRGHGTRSLPIIEALRERGHAVTVFAGADARAPFGGDCEPVESLPLGVPLQLPALLADRVSSARGRMREQRAAVVVSDGDMPAIVAAKQERVPSIAVGHGLVFACCRRPSGAPAMAWLREAQKARMASLGATHRVAVNFVRLRLRDPVHASLARPLFGEVAGPKNPSPMTAEARAAIAPVVCYFRDRDGDALARAAASAGRPVLLFGAEGGPDLPGVTRAPFDAAAFSAALERAAAVISSAGSQLMSECLARRIPQLARFADADDEQRLNGYMLGTVGGPSRALAASQCDTTAVVDFVHSLGAATGHDAEAGQDPWPDPARLPQRDVVSVVTAQVEALARR